MITCFSRSGDVERARKMFDEMPVRDLASWSAMIAGNMNNGHYEEGVAVFREMVIVEQLKPDQVTVGLILAGCLEMGTSIELLLGKSVHGFAVKNNWELNVELGTCLVDMYAKCGFLNFASLVFDMMKDRNVVTWTALICGAAMHGFGNEALEIFKKMRQGGVLPIELTFTGVLSACVQVGLVDEGRGYFKMIKECGLRPTIQHYGMVDLFGKAGLLGEAYEVINTMSREPNVVIWGPFLSSCKLHKQFEMSERVIEKVMNAVRPENDGGVYTLISDLYVLGDNGRMPRGAGHLDINLVVEKWSFVKKDDQVLTGGGDLQSASPAIRSLSVTFQIFRKYDDDNKLPLSYAFHHWPLTSYIIFISSDHDV
ncbi:hypothetical protein RND71_005866 [Anisodus tanguticus]|uniref:Pentatricopeptide repeat-containing protein n=1 Tax=Anisodus tanguticus TaxID=243964 RepID=A0AAE1VVB3_9SOLA|nr:hypothetical protein RND71_005866 [Anisodus tanguticus]